MDAQLNDTPNPITEAITIVGLGNLAILCGVTYQAVRKWEKNGIPRTEWTGETSYWKAIQRATKGRIKKAQLLTRRPNAS